MAPVRKRSSIRSRATAAKKGASAQPSTHPHTTPLAAAHAPANPEETLAHDEAADWRLNKKDKRVMKRGLLLQRVRDSGIAKQKTLKRRRPGKKLKTDIGGLAAALPDVEEDADDAWEGMSDSSADGDGAGGAPTGAGLSAKIRRRKASGPADSRMAMKSLRHRPGALKRKRKMESHEMDRFGRNLAQLAASQAEDGARGAGQAAGDASSQAARWAAIRGFIGTTMEKDPAFKSK